MKCSYCGGELPSGAKNCPHCGASCSGETVQQSTSQGAQQPQLSWWGKIWSQSRLSRKDYWVLWLITFVLEAILSETIIIPLLLFILDIEMLAHRFHDTNRSAWNFLWFLLPIIGPIILLIYTLQAGTEGPNQYGNPPQRIF